MFRFIAYFATIQPQMFDVLQIIVKERLQIGFFYYIFSFHVPSLALALQAEFEEFTELLVAIGNSS